MTRKNPNRTTRIPSQAWNRWLAGTLVVPASLLLAAWPTPTTPSASAASAPSVPTEQVIVTSVGSTNPASAVLQQGGSVLTQYTIINGVEATIPVAVASVLAAVPGINVTPDATVQVQNTGVSTGPHTPSDAFLAQTGASQLAQQGDTGQGVTVAVLDTGIDNLPDFAGRLIGGVDLSGGNNPFQDQYGHGTFVAGLIAGNGASSNGQYSGEAPGANLVAIKVAGATGSTDLATIISGVQWAVNNQATYDIQVLNMSLGFPPNESTMQNPLDMAVEQAWNAGISVVVSAGNAGPYNGTILSPGDDPMVITVGALDDLAQNNVANDEMTDFSSVGPTSPDGWVKPDLVTSGRSVVSLAAPGSTIFNNNPSARIGRNFVGSGTSFSAAITSGAAALLLAHDPGLTPNQVKGELLANTDPGPTGNPFVDGHGALDVLAATSSPLVSLNQSTNGLPPVALGVSVSLSPTGTADTWNASLWSGVSWTGSGSPAGGGATGTGTTTGSWPTVATTGSDWNGSDWNGSDWNGSDWNGAAWNGAAWNGSDWNGAAWNGSDWNGAAWNGAAWNGAAWNGSDWNGSDWNGAAWNGAAWNGSEWN